MDYEVNPPVRIGDRHKTLFPMKRFGELIDFAQEKMHVADASPERWRAMQHELIIASELDAEARELSIARFRDLCAELRWLHRS